MSTLSLKCQCGEVEGKITHASSRSGNRIVCCCKDCQSFAKTLKQEGKTLDRFGGTEIYQTSLAQFKVHKGKENLQSLRLTDKGLLRWYAKCCNTPVGNTISAKVPFIGIIHTFMDIDDPEAVLGGVRAHVQTQYAKSVPDYPKHHPKFPLGITFRIMRKLLQWKIQGKSKPAVVFNEDGTPIAKPIIVNP